MPFSNKEEAAFTTAVQTIDQAVARMETLVPQPIWTHLHGNDHAHRYVEHQARQALVLKSVRLSSALRAGWVLLQNGLVLDAGATMRAMDELDSDIMFIAGPLVFNTRANRVTTSILPNSFRKNLITRILFRRRRDEIVSPAATSERMWPAPTMPDCRLARSLQ